jgi:hypothetical protein
LTSTVVVDAPSGQLSTITPKFGIDGGGRLGGRVVVGALVVGVVELVDGAPVVVVVVLELALDEGLESSSSNRRTTSAATTAATTAPITTPRMNGCRPLEGRGAPFVIFSPMPASEVACTAVDCRLNRDTVPSKSLRISRFSGRFPTDLPRAKDTISGSRPVPLGTGRRVVEEMDG